MGFPRWSFWAVAILILHTYKTECCTEKESSGLLRIKQQFSSGLSSPNPPLLPSWVGQGKQNCCVWEGVTCDPSTGHVEELSLAGLADVSPFSTPKHWSLNFTDFEVFEGLRSLDLSSNFIHRLIQDEALCKLRNLQVLNLGSNAIYGRIPRCVRSLTLLQQLDLSDNQFSGRITSGVDNHTGIQIIDAMQMDKGELLVKYLGVPLCSRKALSEDYKPLLKRITSKVNSWASRNLSYAGILQLVHAVLYGITNYWCKVFVIPKKIIKDITASMRNFLWSGCNEGGKAPLAWKEVCRPREEGGVGLKEILSWNKAAFSELIYDLLHDANSLWNSWVRVTILRGRCFWTVDRKETDSALWRTLLNMRDDIIDKVDSDSQIPIIMTKGGKYDCKTLYDALRPTTPTTHWNNWIWGKLITPRTSFTSWMIIKGGAYTRSKHKSMSIIQDDTCVMCNCESETVDHIWFGCRFSKDVLHRVLTWEKIGRRQYNIQDWIESIQRIKVKSCFKFSFWVCCITATIYYIWRCRNAKVFQSRCFSTVECSQMIITHVRNCVLSR